MRRSTKMAELSATLDKDADALIYSFGSRRAP